MADSIIDVSESDFEPQVLAYSQRAPVVVDFWAPWCVPCRTLGPLLERLAQEAKGGFRLAKVNVDENPNLALRYNVRSIPAVKAFRNGEMVSEFLGAAPEPAVREFIRTLAPKGSDLALEKGLGLLEMGQAQRAETIFKQVLDEDPNNAQAMVGLAKSFLLLGKASEAENLLRRVPSGKMFSKAETLRPLASALMAISDRPGGSDQPLDAAYANALRLVKRSNLPAALDGLLDVLRQNKRYRSGEPRLVFLGILELLGEENPDTRQYRNELASVLF